MRCPWGQPYGLEICAGSLVSSYASVHVPYWLVRMPCATASALGLHVDAVYQADSGLIRILPNPKKFDKWGISISSSRIQITEASNVPVCISLAGPARARTEHVSHGYMARACAVFIPYDASVGVARGTCKALHFILPTNKCSDASSRTGPIAWCDHENRAGVNAYEPFTRPNGQGLVHVFKLYGVGGWISQVF